MQARLSMDILEKGEQSRFIRTERGRFYLRYLLGNPLSKNQDLLSSAEEAPNYARPFTTRRRVYPSPMEYVLTIPQRHYRTHLDFQGLHLLKPERLSESHYEQRMRLESAMDLKLRSDILGRAILFIGYSFRDPNIAYLFRTVNEKFQSLPHSFAGKRAYIVATNPSDFELQLFQERKIEVIPTLDLDRTKAISDLLAELAS
jgi:hypothetical protein